MNIQINSADSTFTGYLSRDRDTGDYLANVKVIGGVYKNPFGSEAQAAFDGSEHIVMRDPDACEAFTALILYAEFWGNQRIQEAIRKTEKGSERNEAV